MKLGKLLEELNARGIRVYSHIIKYAQQRYPELGELVAPAQTLSFLTEFISREGPLIATRNHTKVHTESKVPFLGDPNSRMIRHGTRVAPDVFTGLSTPPVCTTEVNNTIGVKFVYSKNRVRNLKMTIEIEVSRHPERTS